MNNTDLPLFKWLSIDIQSNCNRDCSWCPRSNDKSGIRKKSDGSRVITQMPSEHVFSILDQAAALGFTGPCDFHRLSEPFLDKRLREFVAYARNKNMRVHIATNGDVLRKRLDYIAWVDDLVNQITIGLYDCANEDEREAERQFWLSKFTKTKVLFSAPLSGRLHIRQGAKIYSTATLDKEQLKLPCPDGTLKMLVRYDGEMDLCCDDNGAFNLGNAFVTPIKDLWWSPKHVEIRKTIAQPGGRYKYPLCSGCYRIKDKMKCNAS
jgi:hypothetical protein